MSELQRMLKDDSKIGVSNAIVPVSAGLGVLFYELSKGSSRNKSVTSALVLAATSMGSQLVVDKLLPKYVPNQKTVEALHFFVEPLINGMLYASYDAYRYHPDGAIKYVVPSYVRNVLLAGSSTAGGLYLKTFADPLLQK